MQRTYTDAQKVEILEYAKSHTIREVKEKYGISYCALRSWQDPTFKDKQIAHQHNDYRKNGMSLQRKAYRSNHNKHFYQENKVEIDKKQKLYYDAHRLHCNARSRAYGLAHKEQLNKFTRDYRRHRYATDVNFRIKANLRTRLYQETVGLNKTQRTLILLGMAIDEFRDYIAGKFLTGMTWENYGEWHIDHIIPCAAFDMSNIDDVGRCFHHTNMQPLWGKDNLVKSDRLPTLAFINCTAQKKEFRCPGFQMYDDSPLFRSARDYVSNKYDQYFILSAHYGLVDPYEEIDPYPHTVMFSTPANRVQDAYCLSVAEKREWAESIFKSIDWTKFSEIHFYVGQNYWEPLEMLFKTIDIPVERKELPQGIGNVINMFKNLQETA